MVMEGREVGEVGDVDDLVLRVDDVGMEMAMDGDARAIEVGMGMASTKDTISALQRLEAGRINRSSSSGTNTLSAHSYAERLRLWVGALKFRWMIEEVGTVLVTDMALADVDVGMVVVVVAVIVVVDIRFDER